MFVILLTFRLKIENYIINNFHVKDFKIPYVIKSKIL